MAGPTRTPIPFPERITCTVDDACAFTGVGRTKLYEEITAGRIQSTRVGKRRLILVASLLRRLRAVEKAGADE